MLLMEKKNSGDFTIGIATKKYFKEVVLRCKDNIDFDDLCCRDKNNFNDDNIDKLNNYDYIIIGGGGLILPDTCPNKISCWQWIISKENINKIKVPIYVISIGWNLFFNQNMNMDKKKSNIEDETRSPIFKDNITTLIKKAEHFSLRHKTDVNNLVDFIGSKYKEQVVYEMCPTVWYVNKYWKPKISPDTQKFIAIEIKDDRQWRRYHNIGKNKFYKYLLNLVNTHIKNNEKILYLSHDSSKDFYNYLIENDVEIPYLDNSSADEKKILENYSKIHTIYCTAGHSQMMSYGLGIKIISLVTHPKVKNFCDDIGNKDYIDVNTL